MAFLQPNTLPWDGLTDYIGNIRAIDIRDFPWTDYSSLEFAGTPIRRETAILAVLIPLGMTVCASKVPSIQVPCYGQYDPRYLHFRYSPIGKAYYPIGLSDNLHEWFEDHQIPYGLTSRARGHLILLFKEKSHAALFKLAWL